jgi:hypothetical protein
MAVRAMCVRRPGDAGKRQRRLRFQDGIAQFFFFDSNKPLFLK